MEVLAHGSSKLQCLKFHSTFRGPRRTKFMVFRVAAGKDLNLELSTEWQKSREKLLGLGLSQEDSSRVLGKASGVLKSPYWGASKEKVVPSDESVGAILDFLAGLGLSDVEISTVLKKFPELLGCKLEAEVKGNVGLLESTWGISGNTLKSLLLRKPEVLGYSVDCKGDCMAECTRCWARF